MAVRRDVFERLRFDENLGMKGKKIRLYEETELQERYLNAHPLERAFYEPALVVRHFILNDKMRLSYRAKRLFKSGFWSTTKISQREILMGLIKVGLRLTLVTFQFLVRDQAQYPFWQNYAYEKVLPSVCIEIGVFWKYVRDKIGK